MECVKLNHLSPSFSDEFSTVNGLSGEDFFIDDLLNFPTDNGFFEEVDTSEVPKHTSPVKAVNDDKTTVPETELCLPVNDDCDLEWVSKFVNDSFSSDYSLTCPAQKFPVTKTVTLVTVNPSFQNMVHKRARSKRCRTGGRVWSLRSPSPLSDSSTSCSSTSSSYTSNPLLAVVESLKKPPVQTQIKKKPAATSGRRCNHCFVQKTPQWRTGPLGAKTLCNACGVRFKSGRLLPEYRPACSPTFSSEFHSNNHRKVLEMRLTKMEKLEPV